MTLNLEIDTELIEGIISYNEAQKTAKKSYDEYRNEFFAQVKEHFAQSDYLLPVKTLEVPASFFEEVGMDKLSFVLSRFPGWMLEANEIKGDKEVFVLKRDPDFIPTTVETEDYIISKQVTEATPEIDWDTLKIERPDLFEKLAKPVVKYELDEAELAAVMAYEPEVVSLIQRHVKFRDPVKKVSAKRKKKDG